VGVPSKIRRHDRHLSLVLHAARSCPLETTSTDNLADSDILEDLLFPTPQLGLYGRANGIWRLDKLVGLDLRW
jgi:hypothetical protein